MVEVNCSFSGAGLTPASVADGSISRTRSMKLSSESRGRRTSTLIEVDRSTRDSGQVSGWRSPGGDHCSPLTSVSPCEDWPADRPEMMVCRSASWRPAGELVPPVVDWEVAAELATAGVVVGVCGAAGVETLDEDR